MTSEQVLIEALAQAAFAYEYDPLDWTWEQETDEGSRDYFRGEAALILAALASMPDVVLGWLAEQRVRCPTCGGTSPTIAPQFTTGAPICGDCNDSGTVPFDVVGALVEAGVLPVVLRKGTVTYYQPGPQGDETQEG